MFDNIFLQNFKADLTILLDLDLNISAKRVSTRNKADERFEKFGVNFHQKIRSGFLEHAKKDLSIKIIDANQNIEKINKIIKSEIDNIINV